MIGNSKQILCAGSVLWDVIGYTENVAGLGGDQGGNIIRRAGGVAFNIAQKLAELGERPKILTVLGRDQDGGALCDICSDLGFDTRFVHISEYLPTDQYIAIEDKNGLVAAISDAHSLEREGHQILRILLDPKNKLLHSPQEILLIIDGNFTQAQLAEMAQNEALKEVTFYIVPASPDKANRLRCFYNRPKTVLFCNLSEAEALLNSSLTNAQHAVEAPFDCGFDRVVVTNGEKMACDGAKNIDVLYQTPAPLRLKRVTGAGDVFMASYIHHELNGATRQNVLTAAMMAAGNYVSGQSEA